MDDRVRKMLESCPLGQVFLAQVELARAGAPGIDLVVLWATAGRPRGQSPREWLERMSNFRDQVTLEPGGLDAPAWADPSTALIYGSEFNQTGRLMRAWSMALRSELRADPTRPLADDDAGLLGLVVKLGMMEEGLTQEEATRDLVNRAEQDARDRNLDDFASETQLAKVRRAVEDFRVEVRPIGGLSPRKGKRRRPPARKRPSARKRRRRPPTP